MAERANPKSQPRKGQASPQRRGQVPVAQEVTAPAHPARDPSRRPLPPALAPPLAVPGRRSRAPGPGQRPRVPSGQESLATATTGMQGQPGDGAEPAQHRVRVARLTEAGLRQLGGISRYQRILDWLESIFTSRGEVVAELQQELDGFWEFQEHGSSLGGKGT